MNELLKNLCIVAIMAAVIGIFGGVIAAVGANNAEELRNSILFTLMPLSLLAAAIIIMVKLSRRRDLAPDFLRQQFGSYLNCSGFAFTFTIHADEGTAYLVVHFQNQYARPCVGRIGLRHGRRSFQLPSAEVLNFEVTCESGAYGMARLPLPVPMNLQGERETFEISASASYPKGRGKRLRFFSATVMRGESLFHRMRQLLVLVVLLPLAGMLFWQGRATITLAMPTHVAVAPPRWSTPKITTIWKLGDPLPV